MTYSTDMARTTYLIRRPDGTLGRRNREQSGYSLWKGLNHAKVHMRNEADRYPVGTEIWEFVLAFPGDDEGLSVRRVFVKEAE